MREQVWQKVPKILRRGTIRNDEEYYLIIERLNDMSKAGFNCEEREKAGRMVLAYEKQKVTGVAIGKRGCHERSGACPCLQREEPLHAQSPLPHSSVSFTRCIDTKTL